jgi:hypothetical protein
MPQAIMPGSYLALFGQQLQKTALIKAAQSQISPTPTQPPNPASMAMLAQADASMVSSVAGMDTMLATVGIGSANGMGTLGVSPPLPLATGTPLGPGPALNGAGSNLRVLPMSTPGAATPTPAVNPFALSAPQTPVNAPVARDITQVGSQQAPMRPMMISRLLAMLTVALSRLVPSSSSR